jgi:hypothetical protein
MNFTEIIIINYFINHFKRYDMVLMIVILIILLDMF